MADEVAHIHGEALSMSSRAMYSRGIIKLLIWLWDNHRPALSIAFRNLNLTMKKGPLKAFLNQVPRPELFPLDLAHFTVSVFETYLTGLRKKNGEKPEPSTLSSNRSSLTFLFSRFSHPPAFFLSCK
jgi:hypothetical protein